MNKNWKRYVYFSKSCECTFQLNCYAQGEDLNTFLKTMVLFLGLFSFCTSNRTAKKGAGDIWDGLDMLTELPFGKREKGGRRSKADTKFNLSRPILFLWIGSIEYNYKFGFARPLKVAFIALCLWKLSTWWWEACL